ncbi:3-hydroxyacyl-CoA dehydrogenase [Thermosporothrix hazakensis]|jgi:3-hydroxyacyl-CoA dehydrogenase|uniref:3-hydroxyacyl-CoA dehydrogenase n=1 Tax=Thermosporothrix hazakensis TaxID=644383 RepID=A0A326UH14_THEHA|nr:3-hydroxyacyl-CoA dehydrogenase/enoyl-CoA hydratase family protein [Thermosporothrix hazakensis]PZW26696.1 3-hydroxyacyl-CoA dehydrogenase [Thermosporothrix hazakensis]GCE47603.1 3-hydroxyacyl-CoA dehydrogenase [Thermosporothrix hazakensis]
MSETTYQIRKVGVLGAGVMGAAIAAHLANVGISSVLLDIVPPGETKDRNKIARTGLEKALKSRPASFYSKRSASLITIGNIEDNLADLAEVDWIVEAVVERLDIKQALYSKLEKIVRPGMILSSNTSGLPAHMLIEGRSELFRRQFLITHFFNPVRYMRLLELVPTADTDPEIVAAMRRFGSETLGKGVVLCKDTPNFIANRLGVYGFLSTIHRALKEGYGIGEVDTILGPVMGRPKSAVFRTADLSGLDTLAHVADNLYENAPDDPRREEFKLPEVVRDMVSRGMLGEKSGQGFYKRVKEQGATVILELDFNSMDYVAKSKVRYPSIGAARGYDDPGQRMLTMLDGDDRASQLARETTADALTYAAELAPAIAYTIVDVDNAMRWGFNFDLGSFEVWDLLLQKPAVLQKVFPDGRLPELVRRVQERGQGTFYIGGAGQKQYFDFETDTYKPVPVPEGGITLVGLKAQEKVVRDNGSAALIDMGDGVACLEFHTKMNAIDEGVIEMIRYAVEEGAKQFRALVIGNEAPDFSAGANLFLVLMGARQGAWPMIENAVNGLQQANMLLKYSPIPVVAAPAGRVLGGGCEIVLHCHHTRALAETYVGQVEVGVGVVPAGGGCKELLLRYKADVESQKAGKTGGPFHPVRKVFELVALATVSTSAVEAQELRFFRKTDAITVNRDVLLRDAKNDAIKLAEAQAAGQWQPPKPQMLLLPGAGARLVLEQQVEGMLLAGKISEHDAVVAYHLARVLTGGDCSPLEPLTEQQVLDLEREAFLSLCGMEKTQQRMEAILTTGKPLRN